jgi:hypothetical protein
VKARLLAPENRHSLTLATLVLAAFSYGLQQTMVLPALPSLQQDLHTIGLVLLAEWHDRTWQVVLGMTLAGGGVPLCFGAMAKLVVDAVRPSETGIASGLNTVMRTIGGVVGGQLGATVLANKTISGSAVPTGSAYSTAFWLGAAIAVGGVVTALAVAPLRPGAPAVAVETD